MTLSEIEEKIKLGTLIKHKNKVYTKEEWGLIEHAKHQEEQFDLLQLTKKIQLYYGALCQEWHSKLTVNSGNILQMRTILSQALTEMLLKVQRLS